VDPAENGSFTTDRSAGAVPQEINTMSESALTLAQQRFTDHLPAVVNAVHFAFRRRFRLRRQDYDEVLAEAIAAAWSAWAGLIARGHDPVAVGVCGIANNAIRYVRNGRKLGNHAGGRSVMDVLNPKAGCTVRTLEDWAIGDRRWSPADEAAFRCDFADWIANLPRRRRCVAELLAQGHGTGEVSQRLGITPAAVSQSRRWLEKSWRIYQGEAPALSP
jgi:hypothetical protein